MTASATDILPTDQSIGDVSRQLTGIPLHFPARRQWWIGMAVAVALLMLFIVSVIELFTRGVGIWGLNVPVTWAFAIHNYVWWLGIGHAGTLISALLLLTGSEWRNSLNRFAETMTLFAVACAGIYPVLHLGRPWYLYWMFPYPATMGVWPQFRSPLEWDIWAVLTYLSVSVLFWYTGLIPDLANARDRATRRGWQVFLGILALGWRGSTIHWHRWSRTYRIMAAIAVPLVVSVHSEISLLFAASQLPGWHSTLFPPYFVLGAAFSGFAVVSVIAVALRAMFGLENLVTRKHFDVLGKVLLATGLMTGYGYVFEVVDVLYGGNPHDLQTLLDRTTGAYAWLYWGAVVFNFVPLQLLWWRAVRRTGWALLLVSVSVIIGMWLERYMILVTTLYRDFLVSSWSHYTPTFWDWSTYFGTIGLFLVPFLLAIRFIPVISIFETEKTLLDEREARDG
ncbi:NrfD/PsrC family molybdoenzyme membrane anchor subunit [Nitrobacter sp.]|uniref:NrfD/PsrC family molybdoenzyme membrane anchor subunit n=1 Tax=Nitrobacter sp. TaxID=29420 RepID=UPI0029CABF00|nr:NrfD/PsrC family molybdoenzyme membrane anchor subunit [Nitrobacter sp.]